MTSRDCFVGPKGLLHHGLAALVAASLAMGCTSSESQSGGGGPAPLTVDVMVLQPQPLENRIQTTGTLLANEVVELRPEISGRVIAVHFDEGSRVQRGELLLKINDRELQAELKRRQLEEKLAADDEARKRAIKEIQGISQEEYDRSLTAYQLKQAEREVIESQLAQTEITAPMSGTVGLRYVSVGTYVTPTRLVATLQRIDSVKAEFSVPEKYVGRLSPGTPVKVTVGDPPVEQSGTIFAVESMVDPTTRTLKARAKLPNPGQRLIPGSFARIDITLEHIPDALVVPTSAILPQLEGERVFVCENGKARSVPVTTGIRTDRLVQITSGLKPQDTVVLSGLLQISDGTPLKLREEPVP